MSRPRCSPEPARVGRGYGAYMSQRFLEDRLNWLQHVASAVPPRHPNNGDEDDEDDEQQNEEEEHREPAVIREQDEDE